MWFDHLQTNPLGLLLSADDPALVFHVEKALLDNISDSSDHLWCLPIVLKIIEKQRVDGSWLYKGKRPGDEFGEAYELLETWKMLRILVEMYGFTRAHPVVERAAEFIFSFQTEEGDIRGILSNQYMPYYMGAILEILIKAGYTQDSRVETGLKWLLGMRQYDGGWFIPMVMFKIQEYYRLWCEKPVPPKKELPFSHMATGMVIRAFAAHPKYRKSSEARYAGNLLKSRFFEKDAYASRQAVAYWFKFQFPFWWTSLLTVLDSLMRMGFSVDDADIQKGLDWLIQNQSAEGTWGASYGKAVNPQVDLWVTYAVCRVLKYFLQ